MGNLNILYFNLPTAIGLVMFFTTFFIPLIFISFLNCIKRRQIEFSSFLKPGFQ